MNYNEIKLFLLDMDGTIYLEDNIFDGVLDFLKKLDSLHKEYIFITNNSSKSKVSYLEKLKKMNIHINDNQILTSGMATAIYLSYNYQDKTVYLVGTENLKNEFLLYNIKLVDENPDIVVIGYDNELTYNKLVKACEFIDNGALFLGTNMDYNYPLSNKRYVPDCGSFCKMIATATKKEPTFIGKPNPFMIDYIKSKYNYLNEELCVIGDRIYTDIAFGKNASVKTVCVLTGEATIDDLNSSTVKPDLIIPSIKDIIKLLN